MKHKQIRKMQIGLEDHFKHDISNQDYSKHNGDYASFWLKNKLESSLGEDRDMDKMLRRELVRSTKTMIKNET